MGFPANSYSYFRFVISLLLDLEILVGTELNALYCSVLVVALIGTSGEEGMESFRLHTKVVA